MVAGSRENVAPVRWGILGVANIAVVKVIPAMQRSALTPVVAIASRDAARARAAADSLGIARAYGSYQELLDDPDVDAIYNPLPNHLHVPWSIRAAKAGKHVLCEKPLALTAAEADAIAAAAGRAGVLVMEAFMYRHHPQTLQLKALVDGGAIGRLTLVRGAFTFALSRPGDVRLVAALGGGSLWDVGCYPVSMSRFLAGREPRVVAGVQRLHASGIDEAFYGSLDFGDVHAQFDCGFCAPLRTHLEVVGTTGAIAVSAPFKPGLEETMVVTRDGQTETVPVTGEPLYSGQIENFADAVLLGRPQRIPLSDSRANVAAITALYEAARSGRPVTLSS
jgi:xylose dehydrogenase (NAD/NADP)